MKSFFIAILMIGVMSGLVICRKEVAVKQDGFNRLTPEEENVIIHKGTEEPFSGEYTAFFAKGTYTCKRCKSPLYHSSDKFTSSCGWPSFDDEIKGAVRREVDADGRRTEILCVTCGAHLGHVFENEGLTPKNIRHCVNSISLVFEPDTQAVPVVTAKAYFAGGCFWGVEYYFESFDGVISAVSGFMGGDKENPTYKEVCSGTTGHIEVVEVTYNTQEVSFESLAKFFFEIHDPTQDDGQGPDIGEQYRSIVFYTNEVEKKIAFKLIHILQTRGYDMATRVHPAGVFWKAEDYHQDYYEHSGRHPYCHFYQKKF